MQSRTCRSLYKVSDKLKQTGHASIYIYKYMVALLDNDEAPSERTTLSSQEHNYTCIIICFCPKTSDESRDTIHS